MEEGEVEGKREEKEGRAAYGGLKQTGRDTETRGRETRNMSGVCGEPCTLPRDRYGGIPASGM